MSARPPLRARIRAAWHALCGTATTDAMAMFAHGVKAGQYIAYDTFIEYGVVLDPCAPAGDDLTAVTA